MFQSAQSAFTVEILNYENPEAGQSNEEAALLLTCLRLMDRGRRWEVITPDLRIWDLNKLLNWLNDIVADREVPDGLSFANACLAIELRGVAPDQGAYTFAISLWHEMAPPWQPASDAPYVLSVNSNRLGMGQAIKVLSDQIEGISVQPAYRLA
jgi:hypothetical protein